MTNKLQFRSDILYRNFLHINLGAKPRLVVTYASEPDSQSSDSPAPAASKKAGRGQAASQSPGRTARNRRTGDQRPAQIENLPYAEMSVGSVNIPKTIDNNYLLECFRKDWPTLTTRVSTFEQLQGLISISPVIREWYLALKQDTAAVSSLPDSMQRGGVTPEMWGKVQADLTRARDLERSVATRTATAATNFRNTLDSLAREKRQVYLSMSPLVEISRISVEQLPLGEQVEVALAGENRVRVLKDAIARYQEELTRAYIAGNYISPFR